MGSTHYDLKYLLRVLLTDGRLLRQMPDDRSRTQAQITLTKVGSPEETVEISASQHPLLRQMLDQVPAPATIPYEGSEWYWRAYSFATDLEPYRKAGEIAEAYLVRADCANPDLLSEDVGLQSLWVSAHYDEPIAAAVRIAPSDYNGFQAGDMLINVGPDLVQVPFSLPRSCWLSAGNATQVDGRVPPVLQLAYERDVTLVGLPGQMEVQEVHYRLGWKTRIGEYDYQHALRVV